MAVIGVVALAFGLERIEPSMCNRRIARLTRRRIARLALAGNRVILVTEWEVTLALGTDIPGVGHADRDSVPFHPVRQTEAVVAAADGLFAGKGVAKVYVIAQCWLQWPYAAWLLQRRGYRVAWRYPGRIGYNRHSMQWRDHSPLHLLVYTVVEFLGGRTRR